MTSSRPFFLLLSLILVSQLIGLAWKSRQGTRVGTGSALVDAAAKSLWKRNEVQGYTGLELPAEGEGDLLRKCDNIYVHEDKCAFVRENCADYASGILNYLEFYFCSDVAGKVAVLTSLVVWLIFLFGFVGIAASDFFCPNLQTIASSLHLSESMTGVTFLAFGNGSPDVFSTFSAMRAQSGSLAIGELIGAASFIASVVAGSMAVVAPFRVNRLPFLRDLGFFTGAILIVIAIVSDGKIYLYESVILIAYYMVYVGAVVVGNWWWRRRFEYRELVRRARDEFSEMGFETRRLLRGNTRAPSARLAMSEDDASMDDYGLEPDQENEPLGTEEISEAVAAQGQRIAQLNPQAMSSHLMARRPGFSPIRPSLFGAIEFREVVQSLEKTNLRYGLPISRRRSESNRRYSSMPSSTDATSSEHLGEPRNRASRPSYAADAVITARATAITHAADDYTTDHPVHTPSPIGDRAATADDDNYPGMDSGVDSIPGIPRITIDTASFTPPDFSRTATPPDSPNIFPLASPVLSLHLPDTFVRSPLALSPVSPHSASSFTLPEPIIRSSRLAAIAHALAIDPHDVDVVQRTLLPSLQGWRTKSVFGKIMALVATPILLVLTLTLPVFHDAGLQADLLDDDREEGETARLLEEEEEDEVEEEAQAEADGKKKWSQWLTALQSVCVPVFVAGVLATNGFIPYIVVAWAFIGGSLTSILLLLTTRPQHQPRLLKLICFVGFAISITWIYIIANEVVSVLQAIGVIVGLSEAILGLTIFAMGNSLGDFVANVTIAKMGFPMMAISACFGGPMLNILLGVGISATYMTSVTGEPYDIVVAPTILVSSAGLLVVLFSSLILVPWKGYRITKEFGYAWIAIYIACSVVNVSLEIWKTR